MAERLKQLQLQLTKEKSSFVRIGDAQLAVDSTSNHMELVPFVKEIALESQEILGHLRWMIQKGNLNQDMFLLGPPGPLRRQLAMLYAQLGQREVEYVSLSRDVTDADLKQRLAGCT
jgi:hypothetical protein